MCNAASLRLLICNKIAVDHSIFGSKTELHKSYTHKLLLCKLLFLKDFLNTLLLSGSDMDF